MKFVTIKRFANLTGYSEKAVRRKIEAGIFIRGVHYQKAPDGRLHIDLEQYEKWLKNESQILV